MFSIIGNRSLQHILDGTYAPGHRIREMEVARELREHVDRLRLRSAVEGMWSEA